jgi:anti-anti-sigma regulatory factor
MLYKIDTKENFDIITPQMSQINYNMSEELVTICAQLQKNDKSAIIDFSNVVSVESEIINEIEKLHTQFYSNNLSFAICEVSTKFKPLFSPDLNITPTLIEAVDLISMEGLERELMSDL